MAHSHMSLPHARLLITSQMLDFAPFINDSLDGLFRLWRMTSDFCLFVDMSISSWAKRM